MIWLKRLYAWLRGWKLDKDLWWYRPLRDEDYVSPTLWNCLPEPMCFKGFCMSKAEATEEDPAGVYFMELHHAVQYDRIIGDHVDADE